MFYIKLNIIPRYQILNCLLFGDNGAAVHVPEDHIQNDFLPFSQTVPMFAKKTRPPKEIGSTETPLCYGNTAEGDVPMQACFVGVPW